jgi:hypothetical protein
MDADDWSFPTRLKEQVAFLEQNQEYGVVSGMVKYVPHRENTEDFTRFVEWVNSVKNAEDIFKRRFIESPIVNPTVLWCKELGAKYGLYLKGDSPEDYEMWLRWLHNGVKIHKLETEVLEWYDSDIRLTRTKESYSDEAFYKIKTEYLAKWLVKHNPYHPKVVVWGASKISRKHALLLKNYELDPN